MAVVAPGEHQVVCQCVTGYTGARCELKHVTGVLTSDVVIIAMLIVCATVIILVMLHINQKLKRIEASQEISGKSCQNLPLVQSVDKNKIQMENLLHLPTTISTVDMLSPVHSFSNPMESYKLPNLPVLPACSP